MINYGVDTMTSQLHKEIVDKWFALRFTDHQRLIDNAKPSITTANSDNKSWDGTGWSLGHSYREEWYDRFGKYGLDAICYMDTKSRDAFFQVLKDKYYGKQDEKE
tara:strand:+ start:729 stop:1043 length:315 start_codon:yes stop_codon:yes gene_type:complete